MVECQLPKLKVAGSIPVARSIFPQQNRRIELRASLKKPSFVPQMSDKNFHFVDLANTSLQEMTLPTDVRLFRPYANHLTGCV